MRFTSERVFREEIPEAHRRRRRRNVPAEDILEPLTTLAFPPPPAIARARAGFAHALADRLARHTGAATIAALAGGLQSARMQGRAGAGETVANLNSAGTRAGVRREKGV